MTSSTTASLPSRHDRHDRHAQIERRIAWAMVAMLAITGLMHVIKAVVTKERTAEARPAAIAYAPHPQSPSARSEKHRVDTPRPQAGATMVMPAVK